MPYLPTDDEYKKAEAKTLRLFKTNATPAIKALNKQQIKLGFMLQNEDVARNKEIDKTIALIEAAAPPLAACKQGCAHCCRIAVLISTSEAKAISAATGRPMNNDVGRPLQRHSQVREDLVTQYTGTACPFLDESNACTVYAARPSACRIYYNLTPYPDICDTSTGIHTVANIDTRFLIAHQQMRGLIQKETYADIREFFSEGNHG